MALKMFCLEYVLQSQQQEGKVTPTLGVKIVRSQLWEVNNTQH